MDLFAKIIISVIVIFVLTGFFIFVRLYCVPARKIRKRLQKAIDQIKVIKNSGQSLFPRHKLAEVFTDEPLKHLWSEYQETLHDQHEIISGERQVSKIRATVPAEVFFTTQVLVDTPMHAEFFRHLPGILTGIGIIGTFLGLIHGLQGFDHTSDATVDKLIQGVMHAFIASAVAICFAMVITGIEKFLLARRYEQVETLCQNIDSLYEAGAGEEYLASLVKSSEESATQTKQLKDSLVEDLKSMMTNLVDRQISANQSNNQVLAENISASISSSLRDPLNQIASVVQTASGDQGQAVHQLLIDVLTAFMARIEETFGNRISELNSMMGGTVQTMREVQDNFQRLIESMNSTSQSATQAMSENLVQIMTEADARQNQMVRQVNETLAELTNQMRGVMDDFSRQRQAIATEEREHQGQLHEQTQRLIGDLGGNTEELVSQISQAVAAMRENIQALNNVTVNSIERMNSGAETMYLAASEFSTAGERVSNAVRDSNEVFAALRNAASVLDQSSNAVQATVTEYSRIQESLSAMIASLDGLVQNSRAEAGVTQQIVADMQRVAEKLNEVQQQTSEYMDSVSNVLGQGFDDFGNGVTRGLERSSAEFHSQLSRSVGMLGEVIAQLALLRNNDQGN